MWGKIFLLTFFLFNNFLFPQNNIKEIVGQNKSFLSLGFGVQVSGIKDEDFVASNISPIINLSFNKNISNYFGWKVGYKGFYYHYIEDNLKHYYHFLYFDGVLNINSTLNFKNPLLRTYGEIYSGLGLFYKSENTKVIICANLGSRIVHWFNNQIGVNFDISSIVGWKIYQYNLDILPALLFGVIYSI